MFVQLAGRVTVLWGVVRGGVSVGSRLVVYVVSVRVTFLRTNVRGEQTYGLVGVKGGLNYGSVSGDRERYSSLLTPPLYIYI